MKRILLVSIAFPPKSDPESLQVGRYVKYLVKEGVEIEAITSANPTLYMETDDELKDLIEGVKKITYIKLFEYRYLNTILRTTMPSWLEYPDSKFSFHLGRFKVHNQDIIYSRSYPLSSTILALNIKKQHPEIPWVLHLSDPWAISYSGTSPATSFKHKTRIWNKSKEEEAFELASMITFTSERTIELYKKHYLHFSHKFHLTPNVYDDDKLNPLPISFGSKLRIVYTGGFSEKRSPQFFLEAIKEWVNENPLFASKTEFIFTGPLTRKNNTIFGNYTSVSQIMHLGTVSFRQMLSEQRSAHVLVNIDTDISDPEHAVFFPSKLLEYMAAKRRILAITNSYSTTAEIMNQGFGDVVEFGDKEKLKEMFTNYFDAYIKKDRTILELTNKIDQYSAKYNAELLFQKFSRLVK